MPANQSLEQPVTLLPCPFCGKPPHFTPRQGSFAAYVACVNESCGIQPESGSMDPAYAKARWNTRSAMQDSGAIGELVAKVAPMFPITTHDTPDYAEVHFGSEGHSSQAMTMNPDHWNALNALYEALKARQP